MAASLNLVELAKALNRACDGILQFRVADSFG
jgi:hypothetical protein